MERAAMKKLWTYAHATIALFAWAFILLALSLAVMNARAAIDDDMAYAVIVSFVAIGHLSGASYLVRRIRDDVRAAK